jgi:predicted ATP-dependent serine protease
VAAALASAANGVPPPSGAAFVGEIALTGLVRQAPSMAQRLTAARVAGCTSVFAPEGSGAEELDLVPVRHVRDALGWALRPVETGDGLLSA